MPFILPAHPATPKKIFGLLIVLLALATMSLAAQAQISFTKFPGALDPTTMANDTGEDHAPKIATDGAGHWVATWCAGLSIDAPEPPYSQLFVSRSEDNGLSWSTPVSLATAFGIPRLTQIATDKAGAWVIVWIDSTGLSAEGDLFFTRSVDNGATWTQAQGLCREADTGDDALPRIAVDPDGAWMVAWESTEPAPTEGDSLGEDLDILFIRSTDDGQTWSAPLPLNTTAATDSAAADRSVDMIPLGPNKWLAVWFSTNPLDGTTGDDEDILFARSTDGGTSWTDPAPLNNYAATDSWIDITPRLTNDRRGNVACAWVSAEAWTAAEGTSVPLRKALYVSRSSDDGQTWQTAVQIKNDLGTPGTFNQTPAIHTDGRGLWMAGWSLEGGSLYLSMSMDQGANWEAIPYNYCPPYNNVCFNSDDKGHWIIAWNSSNPKTYPLDDPTLGNDQDIILLSFESTYTEAQNAVSPNIWRLYE